MSVNINVIGQKMCITSTYDGAVSGSQQFVKFRFNFTDEWDGLTTFAQFIQDNKAYNQYLDEENCAYLPAEIKAGTCKLLLYGSGGNVIGTTNYLKFKISENYIISDASSTEISKTLYDQLVEKFNSISTEGISKAVNNYLTEHPVQSGMTEEEEARLAAVERQISDITYVGIDITSFTTNKSNCEIGSTVTNVTLSWKTNITPATLSLDGEALNVTATTKNLTGLSITADSGKKWVLTATDSRGRSVSKTTSVTFCNGVYYGVSSNTTYNSDLILSLGNKSIRPDKLTSFNVTAGEGQYIYYCLPASYGSCAFTVGLLSGGFDLVYTGEFINSYGHKEDYYIYKSTQAGLGDTTVNVS